MGGTNAFDIERQNRRITAPSRLTVGVAAVTILPTNKDRKGFFVVNGGTSVIKLTLGTVDPTQTVYHLILSASTALDDGTGGIYIDDQWVDDVRAISSAAGGIVLVAEIF